MTEITQIGAPFAEDMPLLDARNLLRTLVTNGGVRCPCCTQNAKVYKRKLNSGMAAALIALVRAGGDRGHVHGPSITKNHEYAQLSWWGLIEELREKREDGGRAGWWRVTALGVDFVAGAITVPQYSLVYDGRFMKWVGDPIGIRDALGSQFSYEELMAA